jgi:hypothetical protein
LAKAYAGNNIDGAKINYRVVREARFIYDWLFGEEDTCLDPAVWKLPMVLNNR